MSFFYKIYYLLTYFLQIILKYSITELEINYRLFFFNYIRENDQILLISMTCNIYWFIIVIKKKIRVINIW